MKLQLSILRINFNIKRKKHKFIWLVWLFFGVYAHAQTITVRDEASGLPIEGATLHSLEPKKSTITNLEGQAELYHFENATKVYVRMLGYQTKVIRYAELSSKNVIYLKPETTSLDEITLSITKWKQTHTQVPHTVVRITEKEIREFQPQTTADALEKTGKVFVQKSQQGGGSPMIRGFSANRILLSLDGIRMNNATFRSGNIHQIISVDPLTLSGIDVIQGPGSIIYGSDAIGGVINMTTKNPEFLKDTTLHCQIGGQALSRFTSVNNEVALHAQLELGYEKWAFLSSISMQSFGDLHMGRRGGNAAYLRPDFVQVGFPDEMRENSSPFLQRGTGYNQLSLLQKILYKPSEHWLISYQWHFSESSSIPRFDQLTRRQANGDLRFAQWDYGPQRWQMHHVKFEHEAKSRLFDRFQLHLAAQFFDESRIQRRFQSVERFVNEENINTYHVNADFQKYIDSRQTLHYGMESTWNRVQSFGFSRNISTGVIQDRLSRFPSPSDWYALAFYLQHENKLADKWTWQNGVRWNYVGMHLNFDNSFVEFPFSRINTYTHALTGSSGVIYQSSTEWKWFANLSTAFRAPNVDDAGKVFESTPGQVVVPNEALVPEYAWQGELGIQWRSKKNIRVDGSVFYMYLDNAMVRRPFTFNGNSTIVFQGDLAEVQAIQNAAFARSYGLFLQSEWKLLPRWKLLQTLQWTEGNEVLDNGERAPLRHAPPLLVQASLNFEYKFWQTSLVCTFHDVVKAHQMAPSEIEKPHMYALNAEGLPYSPSWWTLDWLHAFQIHPKWELRTHIENIFDLQYRPYSSGITAPGRTFLLSLRTSI